MVDGIELGPNLNALDGAAEVGRVSIAQLVPAISGSTLHQEPICLSRHPKRKRKRGDEISERVRIPRRQHFPGQLSAPSAARRHGACAHVIQSHLFDDPTSALTGMVKEVLETMWLCQCGMTRWS